MVGTKYLSEVVDVSNLRKHELNIIKAPTGCGKTYFALHEIASRCDNTYHQAVYLIDTVNGKDQIIKNYNASAIDWRWIQIVNDDGKFFDEDNRVAIMTYHKFGMIVAEHLDFYNRFDYIICDELHSLIHYTTFEPKPNSCTVALSALKNAVRNDRTTVVALTATPMPVIDYFFHDYSAPEWFIVPIDTSDLRHYEAKRKEPFTNVNEVLRLQSQEQTGIVFVEHIHTQLEIEEFAKDLGFRPICIWSVHSQNFHMNEEQMTARRSIVEDSIIPEKYNLLIINKASETSIKIKSYVHYMIINNSNSDTQIQVKGRVSNDLETLYLPSKGKPVIIVPERFLGKRLSTSGTEELCEALNITNASNNGYYKWRTMRGKVEQAGYKVIRERIDSRYYYTILSHDDTDCHE